MDAFEAALAQAGVEHEVVTYPGAPHSFFDRKQEEFADASADAWRRVLAFIERYSRATLRVARAAEPGPYAASAAVRRPSSFAIGCSAATTFANVLVELEPEQLGARVDLVAVDAGGERRLLQLLPHRLRLEAVETGRAHEPAGVDETRELVAGEQHLLEPRVARHGEVLGVREHASRSATSG